MPSLALAILAPLIGRAAVPIPAPDAVPNDADFAAMIGKRRAEMKAITRKFGAGQLTETEWADQMQAILLEGHTQGALMGRQLALDEAVAGDLQDVLRGQAAADGETFYLRGFMQALIDKDARYWDEDLGQWRTDAIGARQSSYLGKMRGTANGAFIEESPDDAEIYWRLGGVEDHCAECPEYAAMSPFKKDELATHPGDNDTPCMYNCRCHLEIDGRAGFKPVEF